MDETNSEESSQVISNWSINIKLLDDKSSKMCFGYVV